jgi:hypothetical protein
MPTTDPLESFTSVAEDEKIIRPEDFGPAFSGLHALISGAVDLTMSLCRVRSDMGSSKPVATQTKVATLPRSDSVRSLNEMNMSGQYLETMATIPSTST